LFEKRLIIELDESVKQSCYLAEKVIVEGKLEKTSRLIRGAKRDYEDMGLIYVSKKAATKMVKKTANILGLDH
jgi:hypothetical protein